MDAEPKIVLDGDEVEAARFVRFGLKCLASLKERMGLRERMGYEPLFQNQETIQIPGGGNVFVQAVGSLSRIKVFMPLVEKKPVEEELPHISRYIVIKIVGYLLERGDAQWDKIADSEFDNVIVFNTATMAMATNVYRNGTTDNFVTFPCASSEITEWEAAISDIGKLLFDKAGCGGNELGNRPNTYYPRGNHYWWGTQALWYDEGQDYDCYDADGNLVTYNNTLTTENPSVPWGTPGECDSFSETGTIEYIRNRVFPRFGVLDSDSHDFILTYKNQLVDYYSAFSWAIVDDYNLYETLNYTMVKDVDCYTTYWSKTDTCAAVETRQHVFKSPLGEKTFNGRDTWSASAFIDMDASAWIVTDSDGDFFQIMSHLLGYQNPNAGFATESLGGVYDEEESENVVCQFFYRRYTIFHQEVVGASYSGPSSYFLEDFTPTSEDGSRNGEQWNMLHASITFGKYTDINARNVARTPLFENAIEDLIETAYVGTDYTCDFEDRIQTKFILTGPDMKDPTTIVP